MTAATPPALTPAGRPPASPTDLFLVFNGLALRGFGGVLPFAQRTLVEQRAWMSNDQFVEMLALAQVLPGPNICNLALMVGDRFFGLRGAFAALAGMMAAPLALVLCLAALYSGLAGQPIVARMLGGMSAVSAGLVDPSAVRGGDDIARLLHRPVADRCVEREHGRQCCFVAIGPNDDRPGRCSGFGAGLLGCKPAGARPHRAGRGRLIPVQFAVCLTHREFRSL